MLIIDPTVTVKCRTAIKVLFLYFILSTYKVGSVLYININVCILNISLAVKISH
jgi:hypothetical protein